MDGRVVQNTSAAMILSCERARKEPLFNYSAGQGAEIGPFDLISENAVDTADKLFETAKPASTAFGVE